VRGEAATIVNNEKYDASLLLFAIAGVLNRLINILFLIDMTYNTPTIITQSQSAGRF
jgi:hypothetical protein